MTDSVNTSYQELFESLLKLQGQNVEVGNKRTGEILRGTIVYVMFDSFLVEAKGRNHVIRFEDLMYLNN